MSVSVDIEQQRAPEDILVNFTTTFKPSKKKLKLLKNPASAFL